MSKKLRKILKEIKNGKRINIYDIKLTPEEYLSKDEEGITFLEHLFINKFEVPYLDEKIFRNNVEIAYIYCKYNKSLYSISLDEQTLFSKIDDKLLIEIIAENSKITALIVKAIKNNVEIVDILINTNNLYLLDFISEDIIDKLLIKYNNGIYPIEKYLRNENIYNHLIPLINDEKKLIEICNKYNKIEWLKMANEKVLMFQAGKNNSLLEILVNEKNIIPNCLENIPKNIDFINFLRKNNFYEYLKNIEEDILLLEIEPNKILLEELLEKDVLIEINGLISNLNTIKTLNKFNRLDLIKKASNPILLIPSNEALDMNDIYNRNFLEYMLDNGYNPLDGLTIINNVDIIKILYNKGYYNILGEKLFEEGLLLEIEPGICIIDRLLENDIEFKANSISSIEIAKKIYESKKFNLLTKINLETLFEICNSNNTYFDILLNGIKEKQIKFSLNRLYVPDQLKAKFYITIARHDMIEYIDELEDYNLLEEYENKTLLEQLLDLDLKLTLEKILTKRAKANLKIATILKSRGIEQSDVDIVVDKPNYSKVYLDDIKNSLGIGPVYLEGQFLLEQLYDLFINDGKSDPELISALVTSYRDALLVDYKTNIQELRSLVEIKTQNMDSFFYIRKEESGYFSGGSVYCDDNTISTLLHETGHALHYYLSKFHTPDEYDDILKQVRSNPQTIIKVEEYSKKVNEIREEIKSVVRKFQEESFEEYFDESEINDFLNKSKEEQMEELKSLGISEDVLDIILSNIFTKEQYIAHQKRIFENQNIEAIIRSEFGAYIALGDIIDAVYEGDFHSGKLKTAEGKVIEPAYGHGISYYYENMHGFDEMIANFCMILKSRDSDYVLSLLKDILGDELYNMLWNFYNNNIVNSNETQLDNKKIL